MSHWRRARLASRCPASIYIYIYGLIPPNFSLSHWRRARLASRCRARQCIADWIHFSIKMSHWRRARLAGLCHARHYGSYKFQSRCPIGEECVLRDGATPGLPPFFFGDVVPHIASCGILHGQQCSCHPSTQGFNLVCYPPRVDSSKGAQTGLIANIG